MNAQRQRHEVAVGGLPVQVVQHSRNEARVGRAVVPMAEGPWLQPPAIEVVRAAVSKRIASALRRANRGVHVRAGMRAHNEGLAMVNLPQDRHFHGELRRNRLQAIRRISIRAPVPFGRALLLRSSGLRARCLRTI